jgi:WD40 repeat protein
MKIVRGDWGDVFGIAYAADGRHLVSLTSSSLHVWDTDRYELALTLPFGAHGNPPRLRLMGDLVVQAQLCWDLSTAWRALRRGAAPGRLQVRDVVPLPRDVADYVWLTPAADGKAVLGTGWRPAAPGRASLLRWSARGALKQCLPLARLVRLALAASPDGTALAGAVGRDVVLVDLATGQEVAALRHTGDVRDLAFSPDGRLLASSVGRSVWLWDVPGRRPLGRFPAFQHSAPCPAFHPTGQMVAAGSWDEEVRLWDVEGLRQRVALRPGIGPIRCLAFAPDGMTAAAGGRGAIAVWDVE